METDSERGGFEKPLWIKIYVLLYRLLLFFIAPASSSTTGPIILQGRTTQPKSQTKIGCLRLHDFLKVLRR